MSDSAFDDIAAMSLFIGTGMTVARTYEEAQAKDTINGRWTAQRHNEQFVDAVNKARVPRKAMTYPEFSTQRDLIRSMVEAGIVKDAELLAKDAAHVPKNLKFGADLADETLKRSLVHSFGLESSLAAMPDATNMLPENMTDDMLKQLLDLSPAHMQHAERVYGSFGLLEGTPFGRGQGNPERAMMASLENMAEHFVGAPSISSAVAKGGSLTGVQSMESLTELVKVESFDEVWDAVKGLGATATEEPERFEKILKSIYQKVSNTKGAELSLKYYQDEKGRKLAGLNIGFEGNTKDIHLGLMHETGVVLGDNPTKAYSSLNVLHPNAENYARTGKGRFFQSADIAILDHFNQNFPDYVGGGKSWADKTRGLIGSFKSEESKLLMPVQENKMITVRRKGMLATRDMGIAPGLSQEAFEALKNTAERNGYTFIEGIKAETWVNRTVNINRNAVPGMSVFGQGPGADKEIAQSESARVLNGSSRKVKMFAASGRQTPARLTGYAMDPDILSAFYRGMGLHSMGTHEDTAWILNKGLTARHKQNMHVPLDSRTSTALVAAQEEIAKGGVARISSNQILGIGKDGAPIRLQGESDFLVKEMLTNEKNGVLTLVGHREEKIGDLYKMFGGQKLVFQDGASQSMGWSAMTLEQMLRESGDLTPERMEEAATLLREGHMTGQGLPDIEREARLEEWMNRLRQHQDVDFIGTQGVKKSGEKGLAVLAESLTEQIGEKLGDTGLLGREDHLAKLADMGIDVSFLGEGQARSTSIQIADTGDILSGKGNLVTRQRELMLMASNEGGIMNGRLSLSDTLKAIANEESVKALNNGSLSSTLSSATGDEAMAISRAFLFGEGLKERFGDLSSDAIKNIRESFVRESGSQLQMGKHTYGMAAGGPGDTMLGAGQRGSFAQSSLGHLRAQGGAMGDIAVDIASRTIDEQQGAAQGLQRRLASFYQGGAKNQIPIETVGKAMGVKNELMDGLFSINQAERNNVFEAVGKAHGMTPEAIAKMDYMNIGIGDGKSVYLERQASRLSGPFVTDGGIKIVTDMDKATKQMIEAAQGQSESAMTAARGSYAEALNSQIIGADTPILREFAGKTYGSLRLEAKPNKFEAGVIQDSLIDQVGVRDKAYKKMLSDNMGLSPDQIRSQLAEFKTDGGYGLIARDPAVDMHRVTATKFFSMDSAVKEEARRQGVQVSQGDTPSQRIKGLEDWAAREGTPARQSVSSSVGTPEGDIPTGYSSRAMKDLQKNPLEAQQRALRKARSNLWKAENEVPEDRTRANRVKEDLARLEIERKEALKRIQDKKIGIRAKIAELNKKGISTRDAERIAGLEEKLQKASVQERQATEKYDRKIAPLKEKVTPEQVEAKRLSRIKEMQAEVAKQEAAYGTKESRAAIVQAHQESVVNKTIESTSRRVGNKRLKGFSEKAVWLPKGLEQILGADYDADQLTAALVRGEGTNKALKARVDARMGFNRDFRSSALSLKEYVGAQQGSLKGNAVGLAALEDFSYQKMTDELYGNVLKNSHKGSILEPSDVLKGTPEFAERMRGQQIAANLEKGKVGPITNVANLVRDTLRTGDDRFKSVQGRIFGEALLGLMPEMVLKARQPGAKHLVESGMEAHMEQIKKIMSNDKSIASAWTREEKISKFGESFRAIYRPTTESKVAASYLDDMMSFVPNIVDAASASNQSEQASHSLAKLLKNEGTASSSAAIEETMRLMADGTNTSLQAEAYRRQATQVGVKQETKLSRNIKNSKATFGDIIDMIGKHKKPALIGLGIGLGLSLLSSPGHVSAEEADAAGARHSPSSPSEEGPNFGSSVPVTTGPGKSIRVRGTSQGDVDAGTASRIIQQKYPGADVSYKMEDYREQMNQEYLRKRLMR
jgi:hypothetical protein